MARVANKSLPITAYDMTQSANIVRPGPLSPGKNGRRIGYMGVDPYTGVEPKETGRYNRGHRISDKQLGQYLMNDTQHGGDGLYKDNRFDHDYQVVSAPNKPTPKSKTNRRRVRTPVNAAIKSNVKKWLSAGRENSRMKRFSATRRFAGPVDSKLHTYNKRRFAGPVDSKLHTYNKFRTVIPQIKSWKERTMARYYAPPGFLSPLHKGGNGYLLTRQRSPFPPDAVAIPRRKPTKIRAPKRKRE